MDDIYKKLKEHFNNPKNVGVLKNPDGYARVKNPICGDITDIYIRVKDNQIKNVKFKSYGCLVTIASASALSEAVKDKTLDDIVRVDDPIEMLLGLIMSQFGDLPREKLHCPPASIHALLSALIDYYEKNKDIDNVKRIQKSIKNIEKYYKRK
jgi:nitrogen fixation NifU-like protein